MLTFAAVATVLLLPSLSSAQADEKSKAVAGGGISAPGWMGQIDANEAGRGMTGVIVRHGRRIEVETVETGVAPRRRLRGHFIQVPLPWLELLEGASGPAYRLALYLAYLNWRGKGAPVTLSNSAVRGVGLERRAKWRALRELERRGLLSVERHPRRSPIVRLTSYVGRT